MGRGIFHPDDAAKFFASQAGKPYRPSNGSEGEIFYAAWCSDCAADEGFRNDPDRCDSCPIVANALCFDIADPEYPKEWVYGADGQPMCKAFRAIGEEAPPARCHQTPDMFEPIPSSPAVGRGG